MICEICGRGFINGVKLKLEGSVVSACENCASYGKVLEKIETVKEKPKTADPKTVKSYDMGDLEGETVLVDDYGDRVKNAREKKGIKQDALGKLVSEHESIIHRIESGKFEPDEALIKKLEHKLGIKLTMKTENAVRLVGKGGEEKGERTLGDVVIIRKKKGAGE